jgi:uncharacterized protein DUF2797
MIATAETPVKYTLSLSDERLPLNPLLGGTIRLEYSGQIQCAGCGQLTKKSFSEGFCFRCFSTLAQCDLCIVKPELCHFAKGTCREPEWGQAHCMQPHYVYLANASGLKVGITRASQVPTRWLDQGAIQALLVLQVHSRYQAGLVEVAMKQHVADRTDWRKMLKGEPEPHDLKSQRQGLLERCTEALAVSAATTGRPEPVFLETEDVRNFNYPVLTYPQRVTALNLDKTPTVEGTLLGIKGQYLIFDIGVLNVRKFTGYQVTVTT